MNTGGVYNSESFVACIWGGAPETSVIEMQNYTNVLQCGLLKTGAIPSLNLKLRIYVLK